MAHHGTAVPLLGNHAHSGGWDLRTSFSAPLAALGAALLTGFCVGTTYTSEKATDDHINQYYMWWVLRP
jgi:ammonium transporter Rh